MWNALFVASIAEYLHQPAASNDYNFTNVAANKHWLYYIHTCSLILITDNVTHRFLANGHCISVGTLCNCILCYYFFSSWICAYLLLFTSAQDIAFAYTKNDVPWPVIEYVQNWNWTMDSDELGKYFFWHEYNQKTKFVSWASFIITFNHLL